MFETDPIMAALECVWSFLFACLSVLFYSPAKNEFVQLVSIFNKNESGPGVCLFIYVCVYV